MSRAILLCGIVLALLVCVYSLSAPAFALTKEQKVKQLAERDAALKKIPASNGTSKKVTANFITVELSKACLALVKSNSVSDQCLRYTALEPLDNTDKKYSGSFFYDHGFYHRSNPQIKNHEIVYKGKAVVCVDCRGVNVLKYPTIIVEPKNFVYIKNSDKMQNNTRFEYHDRYVDNCFTARVSSDFDLIKDTVSYLQSGCKDTKFDSKVKVVKPYSKLSYDGLEYQYQAWLKKAKDFKNINCLKSDLC